MKTCKECGETKFWFQFHTTNEGLYTATYDICNKCANTMRNKAVFSKQCELNKES